MACCNTTVSASSLFFALAKVLQASVKNVHSAAGCVALIGQQRRLQSCSGFWASCGPASQMFRGDLVVGSCDFSFLPLSASSLLPPAAVISQDGEATGLWFFPPQLYGDLAVCSSELCGFR